MIEIGKKAKIVSRSLMTASTDQKNEALRAIADSLEKNCTPILLANQSDILRAQENGISESLIDRLTLTEERIHTIAENVRDVIRLPDPIGVVESGSVRPNGLKILKARVPLGVVGVIYEARPNVTVDAAVLCLKSSNVVILRGGKEAIRSNIALADCMRAAIAKAGLPPDCVQLVHDTSRASSEAMMKLSGYIDVLIPRGGAGLIQAVVQNATVPVIETGVGNCHIYVDEFADLEMAASILDNAKTSRPSVCNAAETLLVHRSVAASFLPMAKALLDDSNVRLHGCPDTISILGDAVFPAAENDYAKEYLDYDLAVKVVDHMDEALEHIAQYGTMHSECIITNNYTNANAFISGVDAAAVYVNASTRFTDGSMFGLGAEIGISTQKLHARGPMGLQELTTSKYIVQGDGQIR